MNSRVLDVQFRGIASLAQRRTERCLIGCFPSAGRNAADPARRVKQERAPIDLAALGRLPELLFWITRVQLAT